MKKKSNRQDISDVALTMAMRSAGIGTENHQLKFEMAKWIISLAEKMENPWSGILTYSYPIAGGAPTASELANMERLLRRHFSRLIHTVSRQAFGNAHKRHKKLIKFVAFFERGENDCFHIHMIVDVPTHVDPASNFHDKFGAAVRAAWKHGEVPELKPVTEDKERNLSMEESLKRLCLYIVKLRTKYTSSCNYMDTLLLVE